MMANTGAMNCLRFGRIRKCGPRLLKATSEGAKEKKQHSNNIVEWSFEVLVQHSLTLSL